MLRTDFIKFLGLGFAMAGLGPLKNIFEKLPFEDNVMPALFVGHGSPMNALENNEFTDNWKLISNSIPKPKAILCISAHWYTKGSFITSMAKPSTIHDFGGFPDALFNVEYPSLGDPKLADEIKNTFLKGIVESDFDWGLDHGCWSILKQMYPNADIPVLQLSIDYTKGPAYHFEIAKQLKFLRRKGVLILGSGNIVHNLAKIDWNKLNEIGFAYDWATEVDLQVTQLLLQRNIQSLLSLPNSSIAAKLSIPSLDHYLPFIYTTALLNPSDEIKVFNQKAVAGSLTMTSFKIG